MKNLFILTQLILLIGLVLCPFETIYSFSKNQNSKSATFVYLEPQNIRTFIDEINRLGKLGYKLKATERYSESLPPENHTEIKIAGIVERIEGNTYEYKWFSAQTLPEFSEKVDAPAKEGFYFSNLINYSLIKDQEPPSDATELDKSIATIANNFSQEPIDGSIFILERKNDFRDAIEFTFATVLPATSIFGTSVITTRIITKSMEASVAEVDTRKYQPVASFYSSKVFKSRVSHMRTILFQNSWEYNTGAPRPNYKIVEHTSFGSSFRKKLAGISPQGFEIAVLAENLALVVETGRKVSYHWLKPAEKTFEKTLAEISNNGAWFKMNGIDSQMRNILVFEQFPEFKRQRFEYKSLKVTDKPYRQKRQDEWQINTPAESLKEFEALQNQGYRARSLFYKEGINVLFEKALY